MKSEYKRQHEICKILQHYTIDTLTDQYRENECEMQTKHYTNKKEKHSILIKMEKPTHLQYEYIFKNPNYEMTGF